MPPGFITAKVAESRHGVKRLTLNQWSALKNLIQRAFLKLPKQPKKVIYREADIVAELKRRKERDAVVESQYVNPLSLKVGQRIKALHQIRGYLQGTVLDRIPRNGALVIQCQRHGKVIVLPSLLSRVQLFPIK